MEVYAIAIANILHFEKISINEIKLNLKNNNINSRIPNYNNNA